MDKQDTIILSASYPTLYSSILAQLNCYGLAVWESVTTPKKVTLLEFCYTRYLSNGTCW